MALIGKNRLVAMWLLALCSLAFTGDAGAGVAAKVVGGVRQELGIFPSVSLTWSGVANVVAKNGSFDSAGHRYRYGTIEILPTSDPRRRSPPPPR